MPKGGQNPVGVAPSWSRRMLHRRPFMPHSPIVPAEAAGVDASTGDALDGHRSTPSDVVYAVADPERIEPASEPGASPSPLEAAASPSPLEAAAAARLSWLCTFRQPDLERDFEMDMRREHARAYAFITAFSALVYPVTIAHELSLPHSGLGSLKSVLQIGAYACGYPVLLLCAAVWRVPRVRARVSFRVMDTILISWLLMVTVNMIVLTPERTALLAARIAGTVTEELELGVAGTIGAGWAMCAKMCAVFMAAGLFTRMQLVQFATTCTLIVVAVIVGEIFISPTDFAPLTSHAAVVTFIPVAVLKATAHRITTERKQWSYKRAVRRGARAWEEMKRVELEARTHASRLSAAKDARSKLVRVVMHDLRSPMLSVHNMVDVLAGMDGRTTLDAAPVLRALSAVETCTRLMEGIVSDMLDFERIDSGRLELVQAPFSLGRMLEDAEVAFGALAESKGLRFASEPLPPRLAHARYLGDSRRLLQCLSNGISNAIKFTDAGGAITLRVREGLAEQPEAPANVAAPSAAAAAPPLIITVQDSGVGLSADELEQLRTGEAFAQVGRGQLQGNGGTGLGLSIVRHILTLHGDSELRLLSDGSGLGTSFEMVLRLQRLEDTSEDAPGRSPRKFAPTFLEFGRGSRGHGSASELRLSRLAQGAPAADDAGSPHPATTGTAAPLICLHVEDDAMLQLTLGIRLFPDPAATTVVVAADGREAIATVERRAAAGEPPFDVVLMDNQMPIMGGIEATMELRARGFGGVIIGMTGDPSGSPDRVEFECAGLTMCVDKTPQGLQVVEDELRRLLNVKRDVDTAAADRIGPRPPSPTRLTTFNTVSSSYKSNAEPL